MLNSRQCISGVSFTIAIFPQILQVSAGLAVELIPRASIAQTHNSEPRKEKTNSQSVTFQSDGTDHVILKFADFSPPSSSHALVWPRQNKMLPSTSHGVKGHRPDFCPTG